MFCRNPRVWYPILRTPADQAAGIQPRTRSCDAHLHLHRHQSVWAHRVSTWQCQVSPGLWELNAVMIASVWKLSLGRPTASWDVEAPTFSRQSAHRRRWGCQLNVPAALYSQEDSWYSCLLEAESAPGSRKCSNLRGRGEGCKQFWINFSKFWKQVFQNLWDFIYIVAKFCLPTSSKAAKILNNICSDIVKNKHTRSLENIFFSRLSYLQ
jgi:hypothetical protein